MNKSEILDKLRTIGFKENESKVLFVLLQGSPMSASQIAKESGIIRNSIYDTLKSFVDEGYCNEIETNTILKYKCIDLQVITDKIEKKFNESNKQRITTLGDTFSEIGKYYHSNGNAEEETGEHNIELIRGYNKHRMEKFIEIFKQTQKTIHGMYRLRGVVSEELDDIAAQFINRGGILKSVYHVNLNFKIIKNGTATPATMDDLIRVCEKFEISGEQIRLSSIEVPNMVIFDEETVFNNINDIDIPKNKQADIIIKNKNNAKHMIDLFNFYWEKSMTIQEFGEIKLNLVISNYQPQLKKL